MDITVPTNLLITADNAECCQLLFNESETSVHKGLDLLDLTIDVDWSRKRTLWLVHDLGRPEDLDLIFDKVTECSKVILVLPPSRSHGLGSASSCQHVQDMLSEQRLSIIMSGPMEQQIAAIDRLIDIDNFDGWKPILSNSFLDQNGEYLRTFYRKLAAQINIKMMMKTTQLEKAVSFLKNALINAPLATGKLRLNQIKGTLKNKPALIVSAGPSLNKQMETLARNKDLFTIFAVDRVWPILKKHGITPDVVVSLDPGSKPSWADNEVDDHTCFMMDLGSSPELVWSNNKNHLFTSCNLEVNACLTELGLNVEYMSTGGSVATTAFSIALALQANPIVLIGQDLALTGGQAYAEGYMNKPNAEFLKRQYDTGFDIVGYNGETVRTDRQLLFYKTWFESRIKSLPQDTLTINSTEGGACIEGALQIPFELVCDEIRATGLAKQDDFLRAPTEIDQDHLAMLIGNVQKLIEKIKDFQGVAQRGDKIVRSKVRQSNETRLKKIDKVNGELMDFDQRAKFVVDVFAIAKLESIRYQTVTKEKLDGMGDAVKKYGEVYQSVLDSSEMAIAMLEKMVGFYELVAKSAVLKADLVKHVLEDA